VEIIEGGRGIIMFCGWTFIIIMGFFFWGGGGGGPWYYNGFGGGWVDGPWCIRFGEGRV
jgi:hypothetical protein